MNSSASQVKLSGSERVSSSWASFSTAMRNLNESLWGLATGPVSEGDCARGAAEIDPNETDITQNSPNAMDPNKALMYIVPPRSPSDALLGAFRVQPSVGMVMFVTVKKPSIRVGSENLPG